MDRPLPELADSVNELLAAGDTAGGAALLAEEHPADVAEILRFVEDEKKSSLFRLLPEETQAEVLSRVDDPTLTTLLARLSDQEISQVVDEMATDDAADIVGQLPQEDADRVIALLEEEDQESLQKLLEYPEESAGGIMEGEFVAVPEHVTVEEAVAALRERAEEVEHVHHVYVVDSRGRIGNLHQIRLQPYWREAVALCSGATPQAHLDALTDHGIAWIAVGQNRVDLRSALESLADRFGVKVVRVDSGGVLNGVLLREGLVDEVSVLVYPGLVGGTSPRSLFVAPDLGVDDDVIQLELCHLERLRGDAVWMRYRVNR